MSYSAIVNLRGEEHKMVLPLRKETVRDRIEDRLGDDAEIENPEFKRTTELDHENKGEGLTTADLAGKARSVDSPKKPQPVPSDTGAGPRAIGESEAPAVRESSSTTSHENSASLFPENELDGLRDQWRNIQTNFVDEPRRAVEQADGLVASAMKRLAEVFAQERSNLEHQWDRGDSVSTEDLRVALQRYRSFFDRLLSV
jgi:hypothetical protein